MSQVLPGRRGFLPSPSVSVAPHRCLGPRVANPAGEESDRGAAPGYRLQLPRRRRRRRRRIRTRRGMETDEQGCVRAWWHMVAWNLRPCCVQPPGPPLHPTLLLIAPLTRDVTSDVRVLSDGGFHVLSVDYRGFGDSTGKPTEDGLTVDAVCVCEWTVARNGTTPVCLWGHSLGTGVATNAAKVLEEKVDAIILEAPFTNIWVASINYPVLKEKKVSREFKEVAEWFYTASQIYRKLPGFLSTVMDALRKDKLVFPSDEK
ncbi:hypothetical protein J1605_013578 [Eschrichtius robustus]|uniref:Serine aminopeptidase S33 domain-containing protein n=1 Tax=Eschrichtius robustus TaxID=9764 RepID=A0AB34GEG4_ESCRO|nr:hypothetical protein J1605_013578 [Eschrichtius robustus]